MADVMDHAAGDWMDDDNLSFDDALERFHKLEPTSSDIQMPYAVVTEAAITYGGQIVKFEARSSAGQVTPLTPVS